MTAPATLEVLDRGHRAQQGANALTIQRLVMQLFIRMVDPANIAGTSGPWLQQAIAAILRGRSTAILLATAYSTAVRRIQVPDASPFNIPKPDPLPIEQLMRSLTYTGPGKLAVDLAKNPEPIEPPGYAPPFEWDRFDRERVQYERTLKELPTKAAVMASASAVRYVNSGALAVVDNVVQYDPVASGYIRITKDQPCAFCLMLASRGPVYSEHSFDKSDPRFTGPGEHKVHDGCGCMLRPIYGGRSTKNWTDQARAAEKLWLEGKDEKGRTPSSYSGKDAINAFARVTRAAGVADLSRW